MKTTNITTILILSFVISLSLNTVYADIVELPKLSTDNMIDVKVWTQYASENQYTVNIAVLYQVENEHEVPTTITWVDITGQVITIDLQDGFTLANASQEDTTIIVRDAATIADKVIADRKEETAREVEEIWGDYRQCLEEFAVEQPVRFEAWKRTAALTEFIIPDDLSNIANRDNEQLKADKAHQVCKTLKAYHWIGAATANKVIDGLSYNFGLDDSDSPLTVPITEDALKAAEQVAKDFQCGPTGQSMGLCIEHFTGINRGDPDGYKLPIWYQRYLEEQKDSTDIDEAIEKAERLQCEFYYPRYNATSFEIPEWLDHCVEAKN